MMNTYHQQYRPEDQQSLLQHHQTDVPLINVGFPDFPARPVVTTQVPDVHTHKRFSWTHFVMSIITLLVGGCLCLNPVVCQFSLLGLIYSSSAYSSHGDKAYVRSQHQNKLAKIFWTISAVFMCIATIIGIIVIAIAVSIAESRAKAYNEHINSVNSNYNSDTNYWKH